MSSIGFSFDDERKPVKEEPITIPSQDESESSKKRRPKEEPD